MLDIVAFAPEHRQIEDARNLAVGSNTQHLLAFFVYQYRVLVT